MGMSPPEPVLPQARHSTLRPDQSPDQTTVLCADQTRSVSVWRRGRAVTSPRAQTNPSARPLTAAAELDQAVNWSSGRHGVPLTRSRGVADRPADGGGGGFACRRRHQRPAVVVICGGSPEFGAGPGNTARSGRSRSGLRPVITGRWSSGVTDHTRREEGDD